jgi:hypothetical protein
MVFSSDEMELTPSHEEELRLFMESAVVPTPRHKLCVLARSDELFSTSTKPALIVFSQGVKCGEVSGKALYQCRTDEGPAGFLLDHAFPHLLSWVRCVLADGTPGVGSVDLRPDDIALWDIDYEQFTVSGSVEEIDLDGYDDEVVSINFDKTFRDVSKQLAGILRGWVEGFCTDRSHESWDVKSLGTEYCKVNVC